MQRLHLLHSICRTSVARYSTTLVWFLLITAAAQAAEAPTTRDGTADDHSANQPAKAVARELLQIQQRLGGSVVSDSDVLQDFLPTDAIESTARGWPTATDSRHIAATPISPAAAQKLATSSAGQIQSLRDAAWGLDYSAERLERSDLFQQADALKELARQFRQEARVIRAKIVQ